MTPVRRRRRLGTVLASAAFLAGVGCADGPGGGTKDDAVDRPDPAAALRATERELRTVEEGEMALAFVATAGSAGEATGPVGFRLRGPFSFAGDDELPVLDLELTELRGDDESETAVRSTGSAVFVTVGDRTYRVPDEELGALQLGDGGAGDVTSLSLSRWVVDPEIAAAGKASDEVRITGSVDVPRMLSDLARATGAVLGDGGVEQVAAGDAEGVRRSVRTSRVEITTTAGHDLRRLRAVVDFGASVPDEVRRTLGRYAGVRLELTLDLEPLDGELRVEAPDDAEPLPS